MTSNETVYVIEQDGQTLIGTEWTGPESYVDQDIEAGLMLCLKGATPLEWPELLSQNEMGAFQIG